MAFLESLAVFARLIRDANRFGTLYMRADADLARRGIARERLVRGYLFSLGAD